MTEGSCFVTAPCAGMTGNGAPANLVGAGLASALKKYVNAYFCNPILCLVTLATEMSGFFPLPDQLSSRKNIHNHLNFNGFCFVFECSPKILTSIGALAQHLHYPAEKLNFF